MTKSDDSSLDPDDLRTVEERARQLLDRADAWDRYPVPTNDILAAAKVQVAPRPVPKLGSFEIGYKSAT